jgi:hypothetical protein
MTNPQARFEKYEKYGSGKSVRQQRFKHLQDKDHAHS